MARKKNKFDIIFANGCSYVQGSALNGKKLGGTKDSIRYMQKENICCIVQ